MKKIVLMLGLLLITNILIAADMCYIGQWGSLGSGSTQFNTPIDIVIDEVSNTYNVVYVLDQANNRVQKFDAVGNYISSITGLSSASAIALDGQGNLYIGDTFNFKVKKYNSSGTKLTEWGGYNFIYGIAVDSTTNTYNVVYVTDGNNLTIYRSTDTGGNITSLTTSGIDDGKFQRPQSINIAPNGDLYVGDESRNSIEVFSSSIVYKQSYRGIGSATGQYNNPMGVAFDSSNNVYITDRKNNRIQKFDINGTFLGVIGSYGTGNGQFILPSHAKIDSLGNMYVADAGNHRIQYFSSCVFTPTPTPSATPVIDFGSHSIAFFDFEQTLNGTNGYTSSAVGGWDGYRSVSPAAVVGTYSAGSFSDTAYISMDTHLFDTMITEGTIKFSIPAIPYQNDNAQSITNTCVPIDGIFTNGNFSVVIKSWQLEIYIPSTNGGVTLTASTRIQEACPYTVWISWDSSGVDVWLKKLVNNEVQHIINQHPLTGDTPDFSGCTQLKIGSSIATANQAFPSSLDNIEFYDVALKTANENRTLNKQYTYINVGHSVAWGLACDYEGGDGYRQFIEEYYNSLNLAISTMGNTITGRTTAETIAYPFTSARSGAEMNDIRTMFYNGTPWMDVFSNTIVASAMVIGPIAINDDRYYRPIGDFYRKLIDIGRLVHNVSPNMRQIYASDPGCNGVCPQGSGPYNLTMSAAVSYMQSLGYQAYFVDSASVTGSGYTWCADNIHASPLGNSILGYYLAESIQEVVEASPLPTFTTTSTPTITPTFTFSETHTATYTVTETGTDTITETSTYTVTETATQTVTQTATETVTPTVTETATFTITETVTPTSTETATFTVTQTVTPTSTKTVTRTITQTSTVTPMLTATPVPSDSGALAWNGLIYDILGNTFGAVTYYYKRVTLLSNNYPSKLNDLQHSYYKAGMSKISKFKSLTNYDTTVKNIAKIYSPIAKATAEYSFAIAMKTPLPMLVSADVDMASAQAITKATKDKMDIPRQRQFIKSVATYVATRTP